ncbi:DUF6895 family protein [Sinosporangium siamense]|uniref:DUF6895 domain-containing protein n=1 Tax=Sinosporangium siamense TaxID=1367973 RepID=A0A919RH41_9ACTN|nr:hypothetical protein [Sinosporangium siamense]GII91856.1 hypothetical protein Ssi02_20870 [Sinosporangium siamense]
MSDLSSTAEAIAASPVKVDGHPGLAWVTRNLHHFALSGAGTPNLLLSKRVGELAMLHFYLGRRLRSGLPAADAVHRHLRDWRRLLLRECGGTGYLRHLGSAPDSGLYHLQPYLWLRAAGHRTDLGEGTLRGLAARGVRPRSAGEFHALWTAGLVRDRPDWGSLLRRTAAVPHGRLRRDGYRLTHAVYYATDFGAHDARVPADVSDTAAGVLDRLLEEALAAGDHDLTGESLLALSCLPPRDVGRAARREAVHVLAGARLPGGALPKNRASGSRPDGAEVPFRDCYHATMVDVLRHYTDLEAGD